MAISSNLAVTTCISAISSVKKRNNSITFFDSWISSIHNNEAPETTF